MKYDHIGIPTAEDRQWSAYVEGGKVHITDSTTDPYGIEWLKFDADSPMHELLQKVAHVGFEVNDLDSALKGAKVIVEPFDAKPGVRCAFIDHNGAPVELVQRTKAACGCGCR